MSNLIYLRLKLFFNSGLKLANTFVWIYILMTGFAHLAKAQNKLAEQTGVFNSQALAESVVPIRPGIPGLSAFWNGHSRQFIYAPNFDFKEVRGAKEYRYDIIMDSGSHAFVFLASTPYSPLSPVWSQMPVGKFKLVVTGLDKSGIALDEAGSGNYYRAAWFNGIYHQPAMPYDESASTALSSLLNEKYVTYWLDHKAPDPVMMETYRIAYETTEKDIYLAKAKSIANTFTVVQKVNGGKYHTYFTKYPLGFWLNSAVYPAKFMMIMQETLNKKHN